MFVFCILSFRRSHITRYFYFHSFPSSRAIDSRRLCQRSRACLHSLAQESKIVWKKLAPVSNGSKTKSTVSHFLTKTNDVRIPRRVPGKRKFHEEESAPRIEGSKTQEPVACGIAPRATLGSNDGCDAIAAPFVGNCDEWHSEHGPPASCRS